MEKISENRRENRNSITSLESHEFQIYFTLSHLKSPKASECAHNKESLKA